MDCLVLSDKIVFFRVRISNLRMSKLPELFRLLEILQIFSIKN